MDILAVISGAGSAAWTLVFFVLSLAIIVAVHEYGHYIVGRWSGIHAEVFSLGFGPVIYSRVDQRGTRWQLAALPLGGYVKFLGDKDAASAPDHQALAGLSPTEKRHTMFGAPLWARTATVAAGPIFNFILAIAVYAVMATASGVPEDKPVVGALRALGVPLADAAAACRALHAVPGRMDLVAVPPVSISTAEVFADPELTRNTPAITVRSLPEGGGHNDCQPPR